MVDEGEIEKKDEEIVDVENDSSENSAEYNNDEAEEELEEESHSEVDQSFVSVFALNT